METQVVLGSTLNIDRGELVDDIIDVLTDETIEDSFISVNYKRPYTVGLIKYMHNGKEYHTMTIAKVCWPDKWDLEKGAVLVLKRGAREIADKIINDEMTEIAQVVGKAAADAVNEAMAALNDKAALNVQ